MSKKYSFWKRETDVSDIQNRLKQLYIAKYYNIWMSKFKWSGLDEGAKEQQENFIMRKFWSDGTIAARRMEAIDTMVFTPYAAAEFNLYDFPSKVTLINLRNAPLAMIPQGMQVVNKDVVVGWCQPNHKSIASVVLPYIERMVQVDMVINTNLNLQKMPFLVGVSEVDSDKMKDIVRRILNNEVVVFADLEELAHVQTLATQTPYIIDKLNEYKRSLEQELLTFLGVDNNGTGNLEQTHVSVDAVNANNDIINDYGESILMEIRKWLDLINLVLGRHLAIEPVSQPVNSTREPQKTAKEEEE